MLPQGVLSIRSGGPRGGRDGAGRRRRQFVCSGGKISNAQSFAEFLATSRAAHFNRESHRLRPAALQRTGKAVQYFDRGIPAEPRGRRVRVLCGAAVRGGGGRSGERESAGLAADWPRMNAKRR